MELQKTSVEHTSPTAPFPHPVGHNMRLAYTADGTAVYKSIAPATLSYQSLHAASALATAPPSTCAVSFQSSGLGSAVHAQPSVGSKSMKRKRGRPRKYGPDSAMSLALRPTPHVVKVNVNQPSDNGNRIGDGGSCFAQPQSRAGNINTNCTTPLLSPPIAVPPSVPDGYSTPTSVMNPWGRLSGSIKMQQKLQVLGSAGAGFTPHVIMVKAGEDVVSKIMSFSHLCPSAVCILSANGAISYAKICHTATSEETVTYEGQFEILALSGSCVLSEYSGQSSRTGGISVSLSGPGGRVVGGGLAGLLIAASPVQVVVGSFHEDVCQESKSTPTRNLILANEDEC